MSKKKKRKRRKEIKALAARTAFVNIKSYPSEGGLGRKPGALKLGILD